MIGQILGHYRILEKIGAGGMGEVYRASDDRLGREVAVKVLKPALAGDPDRLRRFEQEARASAALSHPNIVTVYDIGIHEGAPYIVSELLQGQTLRERLKSGPLSTRQAAGYAEQIAHGLVAAHERQIVHRDLKPENLFLTQDGLVKILDFGIAKLSPRDLSEDRSVEDLTTQTRAGTVLGTVAYMSPEQIRAQPVDHRSDLFSLGAILYEMATGARAFQGKTEADTLMAVLSGEPPDMAELRQGIPVAFEQTVRHCLEKQPEDRFQSARDLAFALSTVSSTGTASFQASRNWRKKVRAWAPWLVGGILLAAAGFLGAHLIPQPNPLYQRITFERGTIYSARFSPDGQGILYGASWNGGPLQLYSTVKESALAHPLGFQDASLLAVSRSDELALVLDGTPDGRDFIRGVLARSPLAGGTPRQVLEGVRAADWSPSGDLAVTHFAGNENRLEYPIGKVLYRSTGWINHVRFSPDGQRIAFMDHPVPWDDGGSVCVTDLSGHVTTLSSGWLSADGLAWFPGGKEIWFTAARDTSTTRALWAVDLSGHSRRILTIPGSFALQDIAPDGRVLVTVDTQRVALEWAGKQTGDVRDLSWYDWSIAKDISPDGQWVLFEESSEPAGPENAVAIRNIDGAPPIRLGSGTVGGLSPDGKWAVAVVPGKPPRIRLLPVGPGEAREIPLPQLEDIDAGGARFLYDGSQLVIQGNEPGRPARSFLLDIASGKLRPVTPEGVRAGAPSPDGKYLCGSSAPDDRIMLFPADGSSRPPIPLTAAGTHFRFAQWSGDSKALYVYQSQRAPLPLYRLEIASRKLTLVKTLTPRDRAGVIIVSPVVTNLNGSEFAYSYYQLLSVLYVISGLH
jgi:serine/threonine protein kinase/Tol biopolymer transport system component